MNETLSIIASLGERLASWCGTMTLWTAAILAVALLVERALSRRVSARWRALLYGAVFVRLLVPADVQTPLGLAPPPDVPPQVATAVVSVIDRAPHVLDAGAPIADSLPSEATAPLRLSTLVPIAYLLGVLALALVWLARARALASAVAEAAELPTSFAAASSLPMREHPRAGPVLVGIRRPVLLVPAGLAARLGERAWQGVLRHEEAHVAMRDPILAALLHAAVIVAWPIVPVWIAAARIRSLLELACDERALTDADAATRREYAAALITVASEGGFSMRPRLASLGFTGGLRERLAALRPVTRWHASAQAAMVVIVATASVACATIRNRDAVVGKTTAGEGIQLAIEPTGVPGEFEIVPMLSMGAREVELTFTVLDEWMGDSLRPFDHANQSPSVELRAEEFDRIRAAPTTHVVSEPRILARLGQQARIAQGQLGDEQSVLDGFSLDVRVSGVETDGETGKVVRFHVDIAYVEAHPGTERLSGSVAPGSFNPENRLAILIPDAKGGGRRLIVVGAREVERAEPAEAQESAPFDPLGGKYPQIMWLVNAFEADGPLELKAEGGIRATREHLGRQSRPVSAAELSLLLEGIQRLPGYRSVSVPVAFSKPGETAVIGPGDEDKAGESFHPGMLLLTGQIKAAATDVDARWGELGVATTTTDDGALQVSAVFPITGSGAIPDKGALVLLNRLQAGNPERDRWAILVIRPTVLRSVKDFPFQTSN